MKNRMFLLALAIALFGGQNAIAQETLVDHLIDACASDIQQYCGQVTPGEGRMLHCMAAHEDKISGQCEYAFYQAATVLEQLSAAIAHVATACKTEIETLCNDVNLGDGRLLICLDIHGESASQACNQALADTVGE